MVSNNIVLIGFMGSGKSAVGRRLARKLHKKFVDTDLEIEKQAGMPIPKIFACYGEVYFRDLESRVIDQVVQQDNQVIATGGGAVMRPDNARALQAAGTVVWLRVGAETAYRRVGRKGDRPLLAGEDPQERIGDLLAQRESLYRELADVVVDTDCLDAGGVVKAILAAPALQAEGGSTRPRAPTP